MRERERKDREQQRDRFERDVVRPPESAPRCCRCQGQRADCEVFGQVVICGPCLLLIVREWAIKRQEYGGLAES